MRVNFLLDLEESMKLASLLPEFARELSEGLAAMGHKRLAESISDVEIVERCACTEPGCVTFHSVPKGTAPRWPECERVVAPAAGVTCIHYQNGRILWVEALGRPLDRERLDRIQSKQKTV